MKILLIPMFSLTFFLQAIIPPAHAVKPLPAPGVTPSIIPFDLYQAEIGAGIETFSAAVSDNAGIAYITLHSKNAIDLAFRPKTSKQSSSDLNIYPTELTLDPAIPNKLENYIRADDVSSNYMYQGQKFSLLPFIFFPVVEGVAVSQSVTEPSTPKEIGKLSLLKNWLFCRDTYYLI